MVILPQGVKKYRKMIDSDFVNSVQIGGTFESTKVIQLYSVCEYGQSRVELIMVICLRVYTNIENMFQLWSKKVNIDCQFLSTEFTPSFSVCEEVQSRGMVTLPQGVKKYRKIIYSSCMKSVQIGCQFDSTKFTPSYSV